jgi:hypothetical protein
VNEWIHRVKVNFICPIGVVNWADKLGYDAEKTT